MLSDQAYKNLNEELLRKTGKPIDSMDIKDPLYIELLLTDFSEPESTEKLPQFVDLFLYKLALSQGDAVHGLEKITDYLKVTSSFFDLFEKVNSASQHLCASEKSRLNVVKDLHHKL